MRWYRCPHCNRDLISLVHLLALGPALTLRCPSCRKRVGPSWFQYLVATAPIGAGLALEPVAGLVAPLVGLGLGMVLWATWIRLLPR